MLSSKRACLIIVLISQINTNVLAILKIWCHQKGHDLIKVLSSQIKTKGRWINIEINVYAKVVMSSKRAWFNYGFIKSNKKIKTYVLALLKLWCH